MKGEELTSGIEELHKQHYQEGSGYKEVMDGYFGGAFSSKSPPYIHASLFKTSDFSKPGTSYLYSYTSSGTSGSASRILFTREDAVRQQKMLQRIMSGYIGVNKADYFIDLSRKSEIANARAAAGRGFSLLGKKRLGLDLWKQDGSGALLQLLQSKKEVVLFGFTAEVYMLFDYLHLNGMNFLDASTLTVIHGGGWKKLEGISVSDADFSSRLQKVAPGCKDINYYGMVEQLGIVYPRCEYGFHHCEDGTNIYTLDQSGRVIDGSGAGLIQSISLLKNSYPVHSVLTEDLGQIFQGMCKCGRTSKRFRVLGRIKKSEIRGCSDVY